MAVYIFSATSSAFNQITGIFDFVWPTASAMWNLRWQVTGYVQAIPTATVEQLRARFSEGSDIHGANLRRACIDHSWEQQKEIFAGILLTNTFAIYEGWIENVLEDLGKNTKTLQKSLQFPEDPAKGTGVRSAIAEITANESNVLKNKFYPALCASPNYAMAHLDAMMLCYRFFKEVRNCEMHGGGIVDQKLVDAYTIFLPVASPAALGVKEVPKHSPAVLGGRCNLNLRGVVGFSHIVLRLIATLDAELCRAQAAEKIILKRWKQKHINCCNLNGAGVDARMIKIRNLLKHAHLPKPANPLDIEPWLRQHNLISG